MCPMGNFYETHGGGGVQEACSSLGEKFWDEAGALGSPFTASCSQQGTALRPELLGFSEASEGGGESMGLEMNVQSAAIRARCERFVKLQLHFTAPALKDGPSAGGDTGNNRELEYPCFMCPTSSFYPQQCLLTFHAA